MMTTDSDRSRKMATAGRVMAVLALVMMGGPRAADVNAQPGLSHSIAGQSTTPLSDGTTLLAGGMGPAGPLSDVVVRHPGTDQPTVVGVLHHPRAWHSATLLANGWVAIIGGLDADRRHVAAVEVIDPGSGAVEVLRGPRVARAHHTATLLPTGQLLIVGGSSDGAAAHADAEVWDPVH